MAIAFLDNVDLNSNQFLNAVLQQIAGDHGSPVEGILWYDSSAKVVKFFDGTDVQTFGISGSGGNADTLGGQGGAYYLSRSNHTGEQTTSTISDFTDAVNALTATLASETYVDDRVAALVDSSPGALDTLNELAAALGDDENFAANINAAIALRTKKFAADVGDGAAAAIAIAHNLGTRDVSVSVRRSAAPFDLVHPSVEMTDGNSIMLRFGVAPTAAQYRATITG